MRYKVVAAILLILSFNFVLAAPVQVVPESPADAVWGGGDTVIPGKQVQVRGGGDTTIPGNPGKQVQEWGGGDTMIPEKQVQEWGGGDTMIPGKQVQPWGGGDTMIPGKQHQEGHGSHIDQWLKNQPNSWPLGPEPDQSQPKSKTQDPLGLKFLRIYQRLNRRYGPCQARLKNPFNWGLLNLEIFILCRRSLSSRQARLHHFNRGLHRPPRLKRLLGGPLSSMSIMNL